VGHELAAAYRAYQAGLTERRLTTDELIELVTGGHDRR
jgi:hypothetical protein